MGNFKSFIFHICLCRLFTKGSNNVYVCVYNCSCLKSHKPDKTQENSEGNPNPPKKIAKKYLHWWENLIYKHLNVQENHIGAKYTDINSIKMVNVALRRDTVGKIGDKKKKTNFPKTKEGVPDFFVFLLKF